MGSMLFRADDFSLQFSWYLLITDVKFFYSLPSDPGVPRRCPRWYRIWCSIQWLWWRWRRTRGRGRRSQTARRRHLLGGPSSPSYGRQNHKDVIQDLTTHCIIRMTLLLTTIISGKYVFCYHFVCMLATIDVIRN